MDLLGDERLLALPEAQAMPSGPCAVCATRQARTACKGCGRGVCSADLWALLGLCRPCAGGAR